jgi:hypothetical protein
MRATKTLRVMGQDLADLALEALGVLLTVCIVLTLPVWFVPAMLWRWYRSARDRAEALDKLDTRLTDTRN